MTRHHEKGYHSRPGRLPLLGLLSFLMAAGGMAAGADGNRSSQALSLRSSVMWQPASKLIYPPGVPAVLPAAQTERRYRIEQYYSAPIDARALRMYVRGPWLGGKTYDAAASPDLAADYLTLSRPVCDQTPTIDQRGSVLGYRCYSDLLLQAQMPAGALGLAMALASQGGEAIHPNAVFWIIIPAPAEAAADASANSKAAVTALPKAPLERPTLTPEVLAAVKDKVVRITMNGNFSLGSGFLTREVEVVANLFGEGVLDDGQRFLPRACAGVYIVTAAHLFPAGFALESGDSLAGIPVERRSFDAGGTYDVAIAGHEGQEAAAVLLAKNDESDVAILGLTPQGAAYLQKVQGVQSCDELAGLAMATSAAADQAVFPLGFAIADEEKFLGKHGVIVEYPTEDTSNFGPIAKFKIAEVPPGNTTLAENGMSGGPVVNSIGEVVGISVEKPLASNSLIALDFTSLAQTAGSDYVRNHFNDPHCRLRFNPFDRVLELTNNDPRCDYGDFGSHSSMQPLPGTWVLQEILTLADEAKASSLAGYVLKNGHSIINGYTIVEGRQILRTTPLVVNRNNIALVNASELLGGYRIDPLSFHPLAPLGVRLLKSPLPIKAAMRSLTVDLGPIIVGVRGEERNHGYTPLYSLRDFAIWLRQQDHSEVLTAKLCYQQQGCGEGF